MASPRTCADCGVRDRALCSALDDAALARLSSIGRHRHFAAGDAVAWEGDDNAVCANLIDGVLKLSTGTEDGRESIVGLLYPSDFLGRPFAGAAQHDVTALTDATLCVFPRGAFEAALGEAPAMERLLLQRTLDELDRARKSMASLGRKSAGQRVASFLLEAQRRMAVACGSTAEGFDLPLSRGQIADLLGLTIETVSRQMTKLKRAGIVALPDTRRVVVLDATALHAVAGEEEL